MGIPSVLGTPESWKAAPLLAGEDTKEHLSRLGSNLKDLWVSFVNGRELKEDHLEIGRKFNIGSCF